MESAATYRKGITPSPPISSFLSGMHMGLNPWSGWRAHLTVRLGTDLALALAMMRVIIQEGIYDHEFVENYSLGFDQLKAHVIQYTPEWAAKITGTPIEKIRDLARRYATERPGVIYDGNG